MSNITKEVKRGDLLTYYAAPNCKMESQYGYTTFLKWCEKEVERINRAGRNVAIHFNELGNIAIVNRRA